MNLHLSLRYIISGLPAMVHENILVYSQKIILSFLIFRYLILFFLWVFHLIVYLCAMCMQWPPRPVKGIRFSETRVDGWEPPWLGAENQTQVIWKSSSFS